MDERRFDDLTRAVGRAASRRQVLKGLIGGLGAALLSRTPALAGPARGRHCSSAKLQQCYADAKFNHDLYLQGCGKQPGEPDGGKIGVVVDAACKLYFDRKYFSDLEACDLAQCPDGGICANDHCCQGEHCCDPGPTCVGDFATGPTHCCAQGEQCCSADCCTAEQTCCQHHAPFLSPNGPSVWHSCANLQDDPKNCGACDNDCAGLDCIDGVCQCPAGTRVCEGPWNSACCHDGETCQGDAVGFVACVAQCPPCYTAVTTVSGTIECYPKECGACQECDPSTGQCVQSADGTACGSGLTCCHGACVGSTCQGNQTFNPDTCACECAPVDCNGRRQDPITCDCNCPSVTCEPGKQQNPVTCQCECPPSDCPPGQPQDPDTCQCGCGSGTPCGPYCCDDTKVCCPDVLSGMACRDADPNCPGCTYSCGDKCCPQDEFCCRAADYSYHCVANSGDSC